MTTSAPYLFRFLPREFIRADERGHPVEWFGLIDPRALVLLDAQRAAWAYRRRHLPAAAQRILISNDPGALGRHLGPISDSQHNIDKWGQCRAIDNVPGGIVYRDEAELYYRIALEIGWTGIGFYPHWYQGPGFHLDTRRDRQPGEPATWGRIGTPKTGYKDVSIQTAFQELPTRE